MVNIESKSEDNCLVIEVAGEIDASSSIELDNALKEASDNYTKIIVDLTGLEYISSAGLGVFISYLEDMKKENIKLVIYGLKENVQEVFEILGLQHIMTIAQTKDEAVRLVE